MNFDITEDQRRTQQAARDFAERVLAPRAADVDREGQLAPETIAQLAEAGWLGMTIPEAHGGSGGDFTSLVLAIEEFAVACTNTAAFVGANVLVARALLAHGNEAQQSELLPAVVRGKKTIALATLNPDELLDASRQSDGSYELRRKTDSVTLFGQPEQVIVFGYDADAAVVKTFVVPYDAKNLEATVLPASLGKRAAHLCTLRFDAVHVAESALLGTPSDELDVAHTAMEDGRVLAAAEAIGTARAAYDRAVQHVKTLPKSTEPGLLGLQVLVADMCVEIEAARLLMLRAARQADAGVASGSERSMAKLFATEMATRVAHKALQIHGARAIATNPSLERHFRDARMTELSDDGLEVQRANIAQTMLKA